MSNATAASMLNIGTASVDRAKAVLRKGTPELVQAVDRGEIRVTTGGTHRRVVPLEIVDKIKRLHYNL